MKNKRTRQQYVITFIGLIVVVLGFVKIISDRNSSPASNQEQHPLIVSTPDPNPERTLNDNEKFVALAKMYITLPEGTEYREERTDDPGRPTTIGFYITGGSEDEPYQLYGVYQDKDFAEAGLKQAQKEMEQDSINETSVGGYKGVEGLVTGPKGRYLTLILKDGKLISFSTIPSTEKNKEITEQILSTVSFD
ncbi:hypothetical protein KC726_02270 [Candidatus Woesebacteria bacterium]|nr:hypothetical protein [Candidatus Woesebacteria bacterium]